jgi:predicted transcriptional regulator
MPIKKYGVHMANYTIGNYPFCSPLHDRFVSFNYSNLIKKYRSHFEITALVLEAVKKNAATRFSILKQAGINCAQLNKYLHFLIEIGFIKVNLKGDQSLYRTSEKGLEFLRQYYILVEMLFDAYVQNKQTDVVCQAAVPNSRNRKAVQHAL